MSSFPLRCLKVALFKIFQCNSDQHENYSKIPCIDHIHMKSRVLNLNHIPTIMILLDSINIFQYNR